MCAVRDDVIGFERSMFFVECSLIRGFRDDLRRIFRRGSCVISAEAMASLGGNRSFAAVAKAKAMMPRSRLSPLRTPNLAVNHCYQLSGVANSTFRLSFASCVPWGTTSSC